MVRTHRIPSEIYATAAIYFLPNSLDELVKHGENGFVFSDQLELAEQLRIWFENFPNNPSIIETRSRFSRNLQEFQELRWRENWRQRAAPVLEAFL